MNNKNVGKIIFKFILCFAIILLIFNISVIAVEATGGSAIDKFNKSEADSQIINTTTGVVGSLLNVIKIIALSIALIFLAVLAIKYMVSSVEEKAEIKKHAVVYIVGAIVMFGATGIISIIQSFVKIFDE